MKTLLPIIFLFSFLLSTSNSIGQIGEARPALKFFEQKNRHGLKVSLSSLINDNEDYIAVSYEYAKKNRQSYNFSVGIRGLNGNDLNVYVGGQDFIAVPKIANGVFFKLATRFYSSSMKPRHFNMKPSIFRGFYMEPEIVIGFYTRNYVDYSNLLFSPFSSFAPISPEILTKNTVYQGFMVNFGRQGVLEEVLLLDFSVGFGFATDNVEKVDNNERGYNDNFNHGVINKSNGGLSIATSISLKIGGIF